MTLLGVVMPFSIGLVSCFASPASRDEMLYRLSPMQRSISMQDCVCVKASLQVRSSLAPLQMSALCQGTSSYSTNHFEEAVYSSVICF